MYIPAVGKHVKLKTFEDYTVLMSQYNFNGGPVHVWAWFEVLETNSAFAALELLNGTVKTGKLYTVPLSRIQAPIGWAEVYTIRVEPSKVEQVLAWLARGIVVRQSQYIGDSSVTFQPADNAEQPHWKFCEVTDIVPAEETDKRIRIVKYEFCDASIPDLSNRPTYLSELSVKARKAAIVTLSKDGWAVSYDRHNRVWVMERETVVKDVTP